MQVPGPVVERVVVKKEVEFVNVTNTQVVQVEKVVEKEKIVHIVSEKAVDVPGIF